MKVTLFRRVLFADWLFIAVAEGLKIDAFDWSPSVGDIVILTRVVAS